MRPLWTFATVVGLVTAGSAFAQAPPSQVENLLKFRPKQDGVEYEVPTDAAAIAAVKFEPVKNAKGKNIGYALRDGQGQLLLKFVDSNGKLDAKGGTNVDSWSYYKDGFEIYRELDLNDDGFLDEIRWLNTAGTRVAHIKDQRIIGWSRISAEEATKVFVQGIVTGKLDLIDTVLATPAELEALGLPKATIDRARTAASERKAQMTALTKKLVGWNANTVWQRMDCAMPHLIPADSDTSLPADLPVYENVVIFAGLPTGLNDANKTAYLQAGELVKIGECWKFVSLPKAVDPKEPVLTSSELRSDIYRNMAAAAPNANVPPAVAEAQKGLDTYDKEKAGLLSGQPVDVAKYYLGRIPLLRAIIKAGAGPEEMLVCNKQIADSLAGAYETDQYPDGLKLMENLIAEEGKIGSYTAFRKITAQYQLDNTSTSQNFVAVQKAFMNGLKDFVKKYPKSDELADALLNLASNFEFNAEEDEAKPYYTQLATDYSDTKQGKRAAGALTRLNLVGKPMPLKGTNLKGGVVDLAAYKGKSVLIAFWASQAGSFKKDLPELVKVQAKYRDKGFELIGVNVDPDQADLEAFLKETPIAWPQIHEPGGMEGRLAVEYGIISLPTMILVDPQGKVINRNIRTAADLDNQLTKAFAVKTPGVALGEK